MILVYLTIMWLLTLAAMIFVGCRGFRNKGFEIRSDITCSPKHITVLETFRHHYTGETMRVVRVELTGMKSGISIASVDIIGEARWRDYQKMRVEKEKRKWPIHF